MCYNLRINLIHDIMKKITYLAILLFPFIGISQVFPIDFSDPLDDMFGDNCTFVLTTDAGNDVGSITGGGIFYDNAQLSLAENLDLSDDNNNTITFRIKPMADYGTRTHLLKFEGGTGPNVELQFTTTGTNWNDISLDYGSGLGNYDLMVVFTDFETSQTGTYLIDDFVGGTNVPPIPELEISSPTPTTPNSEVLSVYGDTGGFTNLWISDYTFGETTIVDTDPSEAVNNTLKMDFSIAGYGEGTNPGVVTDVSAYGYFHFDYYTENATQIRMILIEEDGAVFEYFYELPTEEAFVFNSWQSVDIPLTFFTNQGFSTDKFFQFKIGTLSDLDVGIAYFDNLYFTLNPGTSLSVQEFESNSFKIYPNPTTTSWNIKASQIVNTIEVFDVLGKLVYKKQINSDNFSIDTSNFKVGLYFARLSSINSSETVKLIKE